MKPNQSHTVCHNLMGLAKNSDTVHYRFSDLIIFITEVLEAIPRDALTTEMQA